MPIYMPPGHDLDKIACRRKPNGVYEASCFIMYPDGSREFVAKTNGSAKLAMADLSAEVDKKINPIS